MNPLDDVQAKLHTESERFNPSEFDLVLAGEQVDARKKIARHFRQIVSDLAGQLGRGNVTAAERLQLTNAGTLAILCERDVAKLLRGEDFDEEPYRRNVQALRSALISLGLADKSRDVTKGSRKRGGGFMGEVLDVEASPE